MEMVLSCRGQYLETFWGERTSNRLRRGRLLNIYIHERALNNKELLFPYIHNAAAEKPCCTSTSALCFSK